MKKKTTTELATVNASSHLKPGGQVGLAPYESDGKTLTEYAASLDRTGAVYQMLLVRMGMQLWTVKQRGKGQLKTLRQLLMKGAFGGRVTAYKLDLATTKFSACMKGIGCKGEAAITAALPDGSVSDQLKLELWDKGPPKDAKDMERRIYEWCVNAADDTANDVDEVIQPHKAKGKTGGGSRGAADAVDSAAEDSAETLAAMITWFEGDAHAEQASGEYLPANSKAAKELGHSWSLLTDEQVIKLHRLLDRFKPSVARFIKLKGIKVAAVKKG